MSLAPKAVYAYHIYYIMSFDTHAHQRAKETKNEKKTREFMCTMKTIRARGVGEW